MTHAIQITETGGPDVLEWIETEVGDPGEGQVRVRHTAIGVDYIDTYHRTGLYPISLPAILGLEAAGLVEAVGAGVTDLKVGDRVGYPAGPLGAYSEARLMPASRLVKIPEGVNDEAAAALFLKGCTVEYLVERLYPVKPGDTVLLHAAAGGIGTIACQWLSAKGVTIIGTVGSEEKAALARANGCTHTILYKDEDFQAKVMEITDGKGVPVVYDGVGKATFMKSLDCLSRRGMMVTFGNATGMVPPVDPGLLSKKGSLFLTRPTLMDYVASREDLVASTDAVFARLADGTLKPAINQRFALKDAAEAHKALEARQTTGQTILVP
ncbi:quinone oxidoreductase family protein [Kordiimonas marina]|uniref:quinone oxidoreductase family protein n=1 Tax=Kordiimonas marina TaxID=2872312 RepID=UPI001FF0EDD4|nr:quinone oxidoreductase [Kordiimonas marina]MCJ9429870.1 quinone oxidoreductase [Kordiimonas marina]